MAPPRREERSDAVVIGAGVAGPLRAKPPRRVDTPEPSTERS